MTAAKQLFRFFHATPSNHYPTIKSQQQAYTVLNAGYTLMLARCAFVSKQEIMTNLPRRPEQTDAEWEKFVRAWCEEQRHIYLACMDPNSKQYITSSAGPNSLFKPPMLQYCPPGTSMRETDIQIC